MMRRLPLPVGLLLLAVLSATALAELIPFDDERWTLANAEIVEHDGRSCLMGSAYLGGIAFTDGVIEFDAWVDGTRGYPGVTFRATSPLEYENFYFRPHVPNRPDALQYAAAFGGVVGWQLYNGPGFTAAAPIPTGEWIHVRLEILDRRARVFFGEGDAPDLVIDELKHEPVAGSIGIRSARSRSALFSNFAVTHTRELDFPPAPRVVHPRGLIRDWELSSPFELSDVSGKRYPDVAALEWTPVRAEPSGLLDLCRHVPRTPRNGADLVFARCWLTAEQDEVRRVAFGYSDVVTVFLNGRALFTGDNQYLSREETFSGIIGLSDGLFLPLHEGRNELLFAVAENFGGWGVMAQDCSDDYLAEGLTRLWDVDVGHHMPESALYDPERGILYVSEYYRGGNETLARVSLDGEVLDAEWITGLARPCGLILHGGRLWAVDRQHLVEIDPEAGEILARHVLPEAGFPNDVAFDASGRGYVTDTTGHRIYRFEDGQCAVWLEGPEVNRPNGLFVDGNWLLWGNRIDGSLKRVPLGGGAVETLASFGDDIIVDGIRSAGDGGYLVSDFNGRLFHVRADGETSELLNTTASQRFCADFEYIPERELLIVPGLYDNRLTAYRWQRP